MCSDSLPEGLYPSSLTHPLSDVTLFPGDHSIRFLHWCFHGSQIWACTQTQLQGQLLSEAYLIPVKNLSCFVMLADIHSHSRKSSNGSTFPVRITASHVTASLSRTVVTSHMCRHILLQIQGTFPSSKSFSIVLAVQLTSCLLRAKGSMASSQSSVESNLIQHRHLQHVLQVSLGTGSSLQGAERRGHNHSTTHLKADTENQQINWTQNCFGCVAGAQCDWLRDVHTCCRWKVGWEAPRPYSWAACPACPQQHKAVARNRQVNIHTLILTSMALVGRSPIRSGLLL